MFSWLIILIASAVAVLLAAAAWWVRNAAEGFWADLLLNAAAEAFGLILVYLLVNKMLARHHRDTTARHMAQTILHDMDHVVWVWLGGKREFGLAESRVLLERVEDSAHPARFTETMLIAVGSTASNALIANEKVVQSHPPLQAGLNLLLPLAGLRDGPPGTSLPPTKIASQMLQAQSELCKVGRVCVQPEVEPEATYDPSEDAQRWRHSGHTESKEPAPDPLIGPGHTSAGASQTSGSGSSGAGDEED